MSEIINNLLGQMAFMNPDFTYKNVIMICVALFFLFLAIRFEFEPLLLVPIAFGMLLVNIYPDIMMRAEDSPNGVGGLLYYFYVTSGLRFVLEPSPSGGISCSISMIYIDIQGTLL